MRTPFKIIAIRPLDGCAQHILKVLKENEIYYLCNDYEISPEGIISPRNNRNLKPLSDTFFQLNKDKPSINISAIVGKNGDGKSSIIELMLRLLNNLAYLCHKRELLNHPILEVEGLRAEMYFLQDDKFYRLSERGQNGDVMIEEWIGSRWVSIDITKNSLSQFFYTIISNYSLYAYNVNEFRDKEGEWIEKVFHKNDSYQAPVVLHPMRTGGDIDVNNEHFLSQQRLLSILIEDSSFRQIKENQKVEFVLLKKESESKLISKTIREYFTKVSNQNLLKDVLEDVDKLTPEEKKEYLRINDLLKKLEQGKETITSYNLAQFQRVLLINDLVELLLQKPYPEFLNDIDKKDFRYWYEFDNSSDRQSAVRYILYKIISIFERYNDYKGAVDLYETPNILLTKNKSIYDQAKKQLKNGLEKLEKEIEAKSHRTLKIRQAINFLKRGQYIDVNDFYGNLEVNTPKRITNFEVKKKEIVAKDLDRFYLIHLDDLRNRVGEDQDKLEQLPPPIFFTDIYINHTDSGDYTSMRVLSSGQRQMLNVVSAMIYHLQNINSVSSDNLIKYRNVNLIFEEVELYFHPEYQRQFIKYLMDAINQATLDKEMCLNIIFVTHSPFILSDIPKQNVLFLRNGSPDYKMQENTFGANIHSLLKNGFFLDTLPIGEFAHHKINEMFSKLHSGDFSNQEYEEMYSEILLVGEPYLKSQLLGLYNGYKVKDMRAELESNYQKRILDLERRLENLEKQKKDDTFRR